MKVYCTRCGAETIKEEPVCGTCIGELKRNGARLPIKLEIGKQYRLWTNDIIECVRIESNDFLRIVGTLEEHLRTKLVPFDKAICVMKEVHRSTYDDVHLESWFFHLNEPVWPGAKVGDEMAYIAAEGLYCGWDARHIPLHVKEQIG